MITITANSADALYADLRDQMLRAHRDQNTPLRSEDNVQLHGCLMELTDPRQRWITSRYPAMNPAFAIAEVIWIVRGRDDAAFLNFWNPALPKFAGNTPHYHGAYGYRLRTTMGLDQLEAARRALSANAATRQVVLQIYHPALDMPAADGTAQNADIPCNITAMLKVRDGALHWTQVMRSNDILLGLPHNLVQWTSLQEIMAGWLGLEIGAYRHYSDNLHMYMRDETKLLHRLLPAVTAPPPDLRLPYEESMTVLAQFEATIEAMVTRRLSAPAALEALRSAALPGGWRDWLAVLTAEYLRRTGEPEAMNKALFFCQSPALTAMMERWAVRAADQVAA